MAPSSHRPTRASERLANPKSTIFNRPASVTDRIFCFEVAMDDAAPVRVGEGVGRLESVADNVRRRQRPFVNSLAKRSPLHVLHGDEGDVAGFGDLVDRADVRMAQRRGVSRLSHELCSRSSAAGRVGQRFQRDWSMKIGVVGEEHHTHPTMSDATLDAIVTEHLPDSRHRSRIGIVGVHRKVRPRDVLGILYVSPDKIRRPPVQTHSRAIADDRSRPARTAAGSPAAMFVETYTLSIS